MKGTDLFNDIIYNLSGSFSNVDIKTLNEHDLKLFKLTYKIISQPNGIQNAYFCYKIGLTKDLLMKFFKECCQEDIIMFNITFILFKQSVFTADDISNNLSLNKFIPFINKDIKVNGVDYSNFKVNKDISWTNYKNKLLEDYHKRLNGHINKLNKKK